MAKKGISAQGLMALMVIAILAIVVLVGFLVLNPTGASVIGGEPAPTVVTQSCPDSLATDFQADCLNSLNASASQYIQCIVHLVPDGDFSQFSSYTAAATSSKATAIDLKCGHNYVAYGRATIDAVNSFEPVSMGVVDGTIELKVFTNTKFSAMKASAYDNLNKAFIYDSSDASASDQESLGATFYSTTDNSTETAMGVGTVIDWGFTLSTTDSVGQFGSKDVGIYAAVDAGKASFEIPSLYFDGQLLSDVKGTGEMSTDDEAVLSDYEYIFKIPDNIRVQPRTVRIVLQSKSGVDPSADAVIRFCAKGYYIASDGFTVRKDCFNEATSSEIATATAQTITMKLS